MKRRDFLKFGVSAGATGLAVGVLGSGVLSNRAYAQALEVGLSDPALQPMFTEKVRSALDKKFKFKPRNDHIYDVRAALTTQMTGLRNSLGIPLSTPVWGYAAPGDMPTWPGKTFEVKSNHPVTVNWSNGLVDPLGTPLPHIVPVDESLHWCYGLPGYAGKVAIATDGVPLVPHLHGGHNDPAVDGNPEYFAGTTKASRGPRWVSDSYVYDNSQPAGTLWYHDHALGITRLNVYAGLAGFYIIRDKYDTGKYDNPLKLPAKKHELAYIIQDRMFTETGELFYPAFDGDPAWNDYIVGEGATPPIPGGPSALAEFFGDHILVNGKLWPRVKVEPRNYRLRLLNGCDSRFMRVRFRIVAAGATTVDPTSAPHKFYAIGSDQGFLKKIAHVTEVDFMPGERLDLVFDFASVPAGSRVIVENILGDAPFGGALPGPADLYPDRRTDRIMAFDVTKSLKTSIPDKFSHRYKLRGSFTGIKQNAVKTRKLGLYEGTDDHGRLMPMLGTAEPVTNVEGGLVNGSMTWDAAITENPGLGDTEIWEIFNATVDAHPIHVHLVHFEILSRNAFSATLVEQAVATHTGAAGIGFHLDNIVVKPAKIPVLDAEAGPKDMVLCYPGQVTRIKMVFDKPGRYVWHCHILSHEDHEMMRPFHVGPGPF
ncbi:MAG: multicopper oxidase family protein [Thiohalomonadales bacterium]